jgi:aldehyde:ferredoxin oxidoreductase
MQILRANIETGSTRFEPVPAGWQELGGRGLIARVMLDEVPPQCDPLGPDNKLIFAPGLLVGHMVSACDRISVGGKSPLTGGIKEANAGGTTGLRMVWLELHALIIEGGPSEQAGWQLLHIGPDGARFEPAGDLVGLGLQATANALMDRFGPKIGISAIGPAGERLYRSAGITHVDKDRHQTRISARGGLGALMGSKQLKAIVFDQTRSNQPALVDKDRFRAASKRYVQALLNHPQTSQIYTFYGTAAMVSMCNTLGGMPTRNFSAGAFEHADKISGEAIHDLNQSRGGTVDHACMPGCTIKCSNIYFGPDNKTLVTPLEYETIGLMGSNLGMEHPDHIAQINAVADDLGVDTIEIGAGLGVMAEAGLMDWGDVDRALEIMDEMRRDTPLGRILGNGAGLAGKILGVQRVPVVKNQAISAYDPRSIKGTGVTYATSPQGADHTCGNPIRAKVDQTDPQGKAALSRESQYGSAGYDTLGICLMGGFGFGMDATLIPDLIAGRYGREVDESYLRDLGRETILMEVEFNRQAGFTSADDRIPEWMTREKLPPTNAVFDVPWAELDAIYSE